MDYIVLDIEFNGRKFASELPMEVIEIGAVRLDASLRVTDEFAAFVKPVYFAKLNSFIKKKTGIAQEQIDGAAGFPQVIRDFVAWLRRGEPFLLVTWGGEDLKRIIYDTRMHKLDDAFWMATDYFDLLKGYLRYRNVTNDVSVEAALQELGISADGSAHRALDDAKMTADIFRAVFPHLDLEQKKRFKDQFTNAKERRLIKTAVRTMLTKKLTPSWELFSERYLAEKGETADPRKLEEMRELLAAEIEKARSAPEKRSGRPGSADSPKPADPESGD
ncbi:3'-5' exonuclease [Cohnella zeiphila]|uniref:Exonuclease domain-containing protein n=1 Tax=Cohnella zeiphila TaxID=2761120 RepID=A0A7X0VZA7_9BACL|nr:3'-5' exonuclease [Cohnella zeiphila]MBB6733793.1 exonuclease domain-containing protein [Cohnella zeiphila]